jgi:hypothetical protein
MAALRCRWEVVLDILDFVRLYCSDLHLAKKTKVQFGVLAFDLGEVAPDPHQPERRAYTEVKEGIGDTGPSGPWIVQKSGRRSKPWRCRTEPMHWTGRAILALAHTVAARRSAQSDGFSADLPDTQKPYVRAFGRFPLSVSVYTVMTPCPACNSYLRRFPASPHNMVGQSGRRRDYREVVSSLQHELRFRLRGCCGR